MIVFSEIKHCQNPQSTRVVQKAKKPRFQFFDRSAQGVQLQIFQATFKMLLATRRNHLVKNALEIIVDALSGSGRFLPLVLQAHDLLVDGVDVLLE